MVQRVHTTINCGCFSATHVVVNPSGYLNWLSLKRLIGRPWGVGYTGSYTWVPDVFQTNLNRQYVLAK